MRGELASQLGVAERNAQRLLGLVDQLLDIARLDAGRLRLRVRQGDLTAFVRERVEAFLPLAQRREIELSLAAPADAVEAWFDEVQLEKVFDNLLGNALKFTPRGGRVQVSVAAPPWSPRVTMGVRDNGPGIPRRPVGPDLRALLPGGAHLAPPLAGSGDRPFPRQATGGAAWRLDFGRERRGGGGLLHRRPPAGPEPFLSRAGGRRGQQTRDRPSSTFAAANLLGDAFGPEDETSSRDEPEDDRTTVLVVDDNPDIRAYVRRHLEPDYRVVEAADGLQGLERARQPRARPRGQRRHDAGP